MSERHAKLFIGEQKKYFNRIMTTFYEVRYMKLHVTAAWLIVRVSLHNQDGD